MDVLRKFKFQSLVYALTAFLLIQFVPLCRGQSNSSLFKIPSVTSQDDSNGSAKAVSDQKSLPGLVSDISVEESMKSESIGTSFLEVDQSIADETLLRLPRKQLQYLACGAADFGNDIPQSINEFTLRVGNASKNFKEAYPELDPSEFDWKIAVNEIKGSKKKTVKWSNLAKELDVLLEENDDRYIYRSPDLRYLMPNFKLSVKEDSISGVYDVFLFAPDDAHRMSGRSVFRMGVREDELSTRAAKAQEIQSLRKQQAAEEFANSLAARDKQLQNGPEAGLEPFLGFSEGQAFASFLEQGSENVMRQAEADKISEAYEDLRIATAKEQETRKQQAELARTTIDGVANVIANNSPNSSIVSDGQKLQKDITNVVSSLAGGEQSKKSAEAVFVDSIGSIISGTANAGDVDNFVSALPNFRLLLEKSVQKSEEKRRLATSLEEVVNVRLESSRPFVFAELMIKDLSGVPVYGPVIMHCSYLPIPKSIVRNSNGLLFEVSMRTEDGRFIVDELNRPLVIKKVVYIGETDNDVSDDVTKCEQLVLGARLLDIDFTDFSGPAADVSTRKFVRKTLADALGISVESVTFCDSRHGSTILGFYGDSDLAIEWGDIVASKSSPIHRSLQLDPLFPVYVDVDDLYGLNTNLDFANEVTENGTLGEDLPTFEVEVDEQFDLVNLPIFEKDDPPEKPSPTDSVDEKVMAPPPVNFAEDAEEGLAGWAWALIVIMIVIVVVVAFSLLVLFVLSRKKIKSDDDVAGRPVEGMSEDGKFIPGLERQPSTQIVEHDMKASAINRDTRRAFEERL